MMFSLHLIVILANFLFGILCVEKLDSLTIKARFFDDSENATVNILLGVSDESCLSNILSFPRFTEIGNGLGGYVLVSAVLDESEFPLPLNACAEIFFYPIGSILMEPKARTINLQPESFDQWIKDTVSLRFNVNNEMNIPVELFWVDEQHPNGLSQGLMQPHSGLSVSSYIGHTFFTTREDNTILNYFIVTGFDHFISTHHILHDCNPDKLHCNDIFERFDAFSREAWERPPDVAVSVALDVVNQFSYQVELFWTNESGQRVSQGLIEPGDTFSLNSFIGHVFVATRASDGAIVDFFTADRGQFFLNLHNHLKACDDSQLFCEETPAKFQAFIASLWPQTRDFLQALSESKTSETVFSPEEVLIEAERKSEEALNGGTVEAENHQQQQQQQQQQEYVRDPEPATVEGELSGGSSSDGTSTSSSTSSSTFVDVGGETSEAVSEEISQEESQEAEDSGTPAETGAAVETVEAAATTDVSDPAVIPVRQLTVDVVESGDVNLIEETLNAGADVNFIVDSTTGMTALMVAAESGDSVVVNILLDHGASIDLKDKGGKTALELATKRKQTTVVEILKAHGPPAKKWHSFISDMFGASK